MGKEINILKTKVLFGTKAVLFIIVININVLCSIYNNFEYICFRGSSNAKLLLNLDLTMNISMKFTHIHIIYTVFEP